MMNILFIQQAEFEGEGYFLDWAKERHYSIHRFCAYEKQIYPNINSFDLLVVLGGPMGVNDEDIHPWLIEEKKFIKSCIDAKKKIVGVCLGAQMLASLLGGVVKKNLHKEIGSFPIRKEENSILTQTFPEEMNVMHWHGDTFSLPSDVVHLFTSEACENQGFLMGNNILALQFHMEFTLSSLQDIGEHCEQELSEGGLFVQSQDEMIVRYKSHEIQMHYYFNDLMDKFIQL